MKKEVGLWIDHQKTVIVTVENEVGVTREIKSNIKKPSPVSSGRRSKTSKEAQASITEDMHDRNTGENLGRYYEGIISLIRSADSIWIFGPGDAKDELQNRLKLEDLGGRIIGVETVKKMTDSQITTKVQGRFIQY